MAKQIFINLAVKDLQKWFLLEKIGEKTHAIQLEKNYYIHLATNYKNIQQLELEYENLDYKKSLGFLLMTLQSLGEVL